MKKSSTVAIIVLVIIVAVIALYFGSTYKAAPGVKLGSSAGTVANQVIMKNIAFNPATLTVKVGTTVTWINQDVTSHTVTDAGTFDSGILAPGQSFKYTFMTPGTYNYGCTIHPMMRAEVIVQ